MFKSNGKVRWHRRARHAIRHSLRWRLVMLFMGLALTMSVVFVVGMQKAFTVGWRDAALPLVTDYVNYLVADLGSPPSIERAQALVQRLPLSVRLDGPQVHWNSHPDKSPRLWLRHGEVEQDKEDEPHLLSRTTADGTRVVLGLGDIDWEQPRSRIVWTTLGVLLLLTGVAFAVVRRLLRPLEDIRRGTQRFGAGDFSQPIPQKSRDELGDLAQHINTMANDIHAMLEAKRGLLLAISHELRSPLTRARLNTELLPETPDLQPLRAPLLRDLQLMRDLISDLLESERLASPHAALHLELTDLTALLKETIAAHADATSVNLYFDPQIPAWPLDRVRIRLLLRNLLDNARQHGQGAIDVHLARVDDGLQLCVRDHGSGVADGQWTQLAEPFYRADVARQRGTGGVGLGLYLCRLVAQAHGGRLTLRPAQPGFEAVVDLPHCICTASVNALVIPTRRPENGADKVFDLSPRGNRTMSHPALHLRLRPWAIGYALASICGTASAQTAVTPHCGMDSRTKAVGEPISLGAVVGKTGPDDFSGSADAAMAYFRCVNDNGGIHGRPIQYFVMDDQWSPEKAIQAASTLLQDRKVLALVGSTSFVECSANAQRYAESGAMVVAGTGVPRDCFHAKNYVPVNSGPRVSSTIASMFMVQKYQAKSVVCIIPNVPGLVDWACHGAQQWGARHKVKVTIVPINPGSFDASKVMQSVAQTQPDVIVMNLPKGILIPMMAASAKLDLGKSIRFASSAPAYNTDVAKALGPYWKDRFWVNLEFQPIDLVAPDMQNWRAVLDRYGPRGHSLDAFSQGGYLAARMVTQVLLTMEPANLDRARLSEALRKVTDFQSDILCKAFYVGGGKRHNANSSGPMAVYTGTGWLLASASCISADDPELVDMRAEERKLKIH